MIDKIVPNHMQDFLQKSRQPDSNKVAQNNSAQMDIGASMRIDYADFIKKATYMQTNDEAMLRAKGLLESGRLESLECIEDAANKIVKYGI